MLNGFLWQIILYLKSETFEMMYTFNMFVQCTIGWFLLVTKSGLNFVYFQASTQKSPGRYFKYTDEINSRKFVEGLPLIKELVGELWLINCSCGKINYCWRRVNCICSLKCLKFRLPSSNATFSGGTFFSRSLWF